MTKIINYKTPTGFVDFCDDVRHESSGKVTLVGVYNGIMFLFGEYPFLLPKIAMRILYMEEAGESDLDVQIRVTLKRATEEVLIGQYVLPAKAREGVPSDLGPLNEEDDRKYLMAVHHLEFGPIPVLEEVRIKVRAHRGDEVVRLGSLRITKSIAPQPSK